MCDGDSAPANFGAMEESTLGQISFSFLPSILRSFGGLMVAVLSWRQPMHSSATAARPALQWQHNYTLGPDPTAYATIATVPKV